MKKKDLILYYQNKLYELEYGYWELHTGIWNSISMIDNNNTEKGECIIWASNLLHGGAPISNPNSTRYAQATHFYFEGCNHYYAPMFSDVVNGKYSKKNLSEKDILGHEI